MLQVRRQKRRKFLESINIAPLIATGTPYVPAVISGTLTASAFMGPRYRIYFFEQSTTTDKATFGDPVLIYQHSNPVLCDRHGNLPAVYLTPGENYTVVIKNARNVQLYEEDI